MNNNITYFDSFGVEHIPKEIKKSTGNKNIETIILWTEKYDSVMRWHFSFGFIDFKLKVKSLTDFFHQIVLKKWW